ncbi:hypothetical protein Pmar_PMAR023027 [Perkinsus marinus ATCC 50983]|uniref:Uncharacterized protein n=1 Tax=Perkinsus marinus (strain ATCC 50983 / TXsc) TaxID=423536 RepID=C5LHX5_PERM5|nr:hypothetical protein Pmar_PMAR023027 [Perkinsus marinus ATCC 50983]EER03729.1 hypothetical protein Pmar_PMAR023027 [Perkinsus marinus ATCC 50983]|eukprot:XP_002771913.1 hypothetical protein Pmar_PMAR023027 [Perkinsus marinus ATCC 50983]
MRFGEFDQKVWFAILKLSYKASEWSEAKELVSLYDYHALYYRATESVKALINPSGILSFSYCLSRLKPQLAKELPMRTVAMAQAEWCLKRKEEFAPYEWDRIKSWLRSKNGYHCGRRYAVEMSQYKKLTRGPKLRLTAA